MKRALLAGTMAGVMLAAPTAHGEAVSNGSDFYALCSDLRARADVAEFAAIWLAPIAAVWSMFWIFAPLRAICRPGRSQPATRNGP